MIGINCDFCRDILTLFKEDILQCLFPRKKAKQLIWSLQQLLQYKDEICRRIQEQMVTTPGNRCKGTVLTWVEQVNRLQEDILRNLESGSDVSKCSTLWRRFSCSSRYRLGGTISETLRCAEELLENGKELNNSNLFEPSPPPRVEELRHSTSNIIGSDEKVNEILGHLQNDEVRVIGIYGAGGIGKTTLMKELNNKTLSFTTYPEFDLVIWVVVSQDVDIYKIQDQIGRRIGANLPDELNLRADHLFKILKEKNFLILLDDLWTKLDLDIVGIPLPSSKSNGKIVFTTRLSGVCRDMNAHRDMKLDLLDESNSWDLFCLNLGPYVDLCNNKALLECAGKVVRRCRGLPLALIAIGKAFGCYGNSILEWDSGLESLMKSPTDIPGIEGELLTLLKFSFDRLQDKELQLCLLYCSLYPYDFNISTSFIIQQWVGEGILQNAKGYREEYVSLRRRGLLVISKLKSACLLESSELGDRFVKMHDSVRDMCLWITKGYISNLLYENFLVYNTCEYSSQLELEEWATSTKISFIGSRITHIGSQNTGRQQNPRLMTMLLNNCHSLFRIHDDFFQLMPSLRVLDLTGVKLKELPKSIVCLVELRFLNLKSTRIERLPKEFGNLLNLRQLYLENTLHLRYIPKEALSNLSRLQCLCVLRSSFQWGLEIEDDHGSTIQVRDLQKLKMLDEIGIDVKSVIAFGELLKYFSTRAMSRLTALRFLGDEFTQEHVSSAYLSFQRMRRFWISDCNNVKELIFSKGYDSSLEWLSLNNVANLKSISVIIDEVEYEEGNEIFDAHVMPIPRSHCFPVARLLTIYIQGSNYLQDLSCVLNIPTLETVKLSNCKALREILSAFSSHQMTTATKKTPFPRLQYIELENLPSFKRISSTEPLSFPSLRFLCVSHCPELKKLPFDLEIAKSIKRIRGSREWWKNLQWDVDETECALRAHFQATHS